MKAEELVFSCAARTVSLMNERAFDASRRFAEALVSHLFVRELLDRDEQLGRRIWLEYRPWPEETDEKIDVWVDGEGDARSFAIEFKIGDPTPLASTERAELRGGIVADFLKLGTAMACSGLDVGSR